MLQWSSKYETGVPLIDTQHQVLFEHINKLEALTCAPEIFRNDVDRLLQFLESYVINHFRFEEQCTRRYNCPNHEENSRAHADFLQSFRELMVEYRTEGPTRGFLTKLYDVSSNWIHRHILQIDSRLKTVVPPTK